MAITIKRYEVSQLPQSVIEIPHQNRILTVKEQNDKIYAWAEVNEESEPEPVSFRVVLTLGNSYYGTYLLSDNYKYEYLGTVILSGVAHHIYFNSPNHVTSTDWVKNYV